ncbi:MAG: hypothetical protein NTY22_07545 [Proteobacteria bacterium]|nr:hypothetical protein [Pseudomonadota bacterium]
MRFLVISIMCVFSMSLFAQSNDDEAKKEAEMKKAESSLMDKLSDGKAMEAKAEAKSLLELKSMPSLYPTIEKLINDTSVIENCSDNRKALIALFNAYPVMFETAIYDANNNRISENGFRADILKAIANRLFSTLNSKCSADKASVYSELNILRKDVYNKSHKSASLFNFFYGMCLEHHVISSLTD